jgi:general secretion pathway protein A
MPLSHFNLREQPFGVTPDPRYLFASESHKEALASLLYGMEAGLGFVALIGMPGTGKTTLVFETLRRMENTAKIVFLFQAIQAPSGLVRTLLFELGVRDLTRSIVELQEQLNGLLVAHSATGKPFIVVIDEAQNLSEPVLEAVRMLSNFETARHKLIQVVLSGQPQLEEKLALPRMLRLRQRISILRRLRPLSLPETTAYISHRLRIAGHDPANPLFTRSALDLVAWWSGGIPRNINNICFNALSLGCALQCKMIDSSLIEEIVCDLCLADHDDSVRASQYPDEDKRNTAASRPSAKRRESKIRLLPPLPAICVIALLNAWPFAPNRDRGLSPDFSVPGRFQYSHVRDLPPHQSSPLCRIPGSDR